MNGRLRPLPAVQTFRGRMTASDPRPTFSRLANSMKFARELRNSIDARLAIIAMITSLGGFAIAHWNGHRLAGESKYGGSFANLHYDLGFSQAAWAVFSVMMFVGISIGIATRLKSIESRRLAAQLFMSAGIFCLLNLILLEFQPIGTQ